MKNGFLFEILKLLATLASGSGKQKKLFILIYHRVMDKPDFMRPGEVDKSMFDWQMNLMAKYFNVLSLNEAVERLKTNALPPRAVCITFDDGYADNLNNALPILKKHKLSATFFIANGFLNGGRMWNDTIIEAVRNASGDQFDLRDCGLESYPIATEQERTHSAERIIKNIKHQAPDIRMSLTNRIAAKSQNLPNDLMLTTEQLQELHQSGGEIGGHTVNHPILAKLDASTAIQEIAENKQFLESTLGCTLKFFAYPNGKPGSDYLPEHVEIVRQQGYQAALSTSWATAKHNNDLWQLPRFTPWDETPLKFMLRMIKVYASK